MFANGFIPEAVKNDFEESTEYQSVLDIKVIEVKNLARYLNMPHISTQHGVKGESHSSVIFMASDNNSTPNVRMYECTHFLSCGQIWNFLFLNLKHCSIHIIG